MTARVQTREAAALLGVSRRTVQAMTARGELPGTSAAISGRLVASIPIYGPSAFTIYATCLRSRRFGTALVFTHLVSTWDIQASSSRSDPI